MAVAGVDMSGMSATRARALLDRRIASRLERPVIVRLGKRRRLVRAGDVRVDVEVERMVAAALRRSRGGNFVGRALRELTGRRLPAAIPLEVTYSSDAVAALVHVERALERAARDAKVLPSAAALRVVPSRNGRAVRGRELARAIAARFVRPGARRVSIGRPASHGSIRMTIPDVIELYERVPVSTPVYIH